MEEQKGHVSVKDFASHGSNMGKPPKETSQSTAQPPSDQTGSVTALTDRRASDRSVDPQQKDVNKCNSLDTSHSSPGTGPNSVTAIPSSVDKTSPCQSPSITYSATSAKSCQKDVCPTDTSSSNRPTQQRQPQAVTRQDQSQTAITAVRNVGAVLAVPEDSTDISKDTKDIMELHPVDKDSIPESKNSPSRDITNKDEVTNIPNTNFAIACMVTLCFNLPLGLLAMYLSLRAVQAFQQGHVKLGQKRSRWSIIASLLGIAITTVIISSIVLYIAMEGQKRIRKHKAYGIKGGLNL